MVAQLDMFAPPTEHGIVRLKRDELLATAPPVAIDLMRRVKKAFDPAGVMNPGRVI